ncbi:MAG: substrate-binding domain-containing protein, partial [Deltaproteobacteria bacterium]|nr:substrate-binding domain-containing protein [Deltaproteobacteria bacterium]
LIISGLIAIMLGISGMAYAGEIIVIGNKSISESALKKQDLKNIFLGKKSTWSDNKKIVFFIQNNSSVSDQFFSEYINKSSAQFSSYWKEKVFTGQGTPPKSFSSDEEMVQFVSQTDGAIGYVSSSEGLDTVKIFTIE